MTRSRMSDPSFQKAGIWFPHRGVSLHMENRLSGTTSGIMMADISRDNNSHIKYPLKFIKRMESRGENRNPFSEHDNRNGLQNNGEYFSQGMGRHKVKDNVNLKRDINIITWESPRPEPLVQNSLYREDYLRRDVKPLSQVSYRRFGKHLPHLNEGLVPLSSGTTLWDPENKMSEKDYFQVLADTQTYIKPNPWLYSYNAHSFSNLPKTSRSRNRSRRKSTTAH